MTICDKPKTPVRMMIVTNTGRTFLWYPPSFQGERQLVDITDKPWSVTSSDCGSWPEVVNCLKSHGHEIIDHLEVDD